MAPVNRSHRSRIPSIRAVHELRSYQDYVRSAASVGGLVVAGAVPDVLHLLLDGDNFFAAGLCLQQLIHLQEGFLERRLVVPLLEVGISE